MWRGLGWGSALTFIFILVAIITGDWKFSINAVGLAGAGALVLAMILSGSLHSGAGMRAMFAGEDKADRELRNSRVIWLTMFAVPNIAATLIIYRFI